MPKIEIVGLVRGFVHEQSQRVYGGGGDFANSANKRVSYDRGETMTDHIEWPTANSTGFMVAHEGDGLVMERLNRARGTVQNQITPTITCGTGGGPGRSQEEGSE